jgi:hypothetical protein
MADHENNLVGCVNDDNSKLCANLPTLRARFVTAVTKGKPGHWATLGGDARRGQLSVMYEGRRIDASYDPMRKQGAVILGNGGDNSAASQGTFYEGAMTAPRTYPSNETDQLVAQNVAAARYDVAAVSVGTAPDTPSGLHTFAPRESRDMTVTFTNTTGASVRGVTLSLDVPQGWHAGAAQSFADTIAPGQSVHAVFKVTSGAAALNADVRGIATWTDATSHGCRVESAAAKVRNVAPVKINEFRLSDGARGNATNAFIELYNAGDKPVDISHWTFTQDAARAPVFS